MSDFLLRLAEQPATRSLIKSIGLPTPQKLARAEGPYADEQLSGRRILMGASQNAFAATAVEAALKEAGAQLDRSAPETLGDEHKFNGLVFDATGLAGPADIKELYNFFHPVIRKIKANARIVVLAQNPETAPDVHSRTAARAVEGFVRSLGKEIGKKGATANLVNVQKGAEKQVAGPLRFFLSDHSTYVDGQAVTVNKPKKAPSKIAHSQALAGKVALVTGGARGIGAATAARLAAEGAKVVVLDIPQDAETLQATADKIGGEALALDITGADTPKAIVDYFSSKHGGVDIVIHNAGVTRDKTIANMNEKFWDMVQAINLESIVRVDDALLEAGTLNEHSRVVCLSSIGGIAGNLGQTNYGATKAGLIGYVEARAEEQAGKGINFNAAAPGFIETRMTAEMPMMIREAGRRMNSMSQGGQPEDVAELICFLSTPGAAGVSGNVVRVCGQSLIGA
ncbi:MAG: 3-oxoacyl-ACP reductase [Oceanococcus sp.]